MTDPPPSALLIEVHLALVIRLPVYHEVPKFRTSDVLSLQLLV